MDINRLKDTTMKNLMRNSMAVVLMSAAFYGCGNDEFIKPDYYTTDASTQLGQSVGDGADGYITHVKSDEETKVMDGVTLLDMGYLNSESHAMQIYLYRVELAPALIKMSTPDDLDKVEKVQKLTEQASAVENKGNYLVMGGISGGAFDPVTGQPVGMLYHNGKAIGSTFGKKDEHTAFFAIMKDGSAVCVESDTFEDRKSKIKEGVSGASLILKNGYVLSDVDADIKARSAVGVDESGSTVYLIVADGGSFFYSNGIKSSDLARLLKGAGAADAMVLDAGNNVSAFWRNENSIDMFEVINRPSNMGLEAEIGNGIFILQQ